MEKFRYILTKITYEVSGITLQNGANLKIPVSEENGFHIGENAITILYEGAGAAMLNYLALPSQANETVTVNPLSVKLQYRTINQTAAYTGLKQSCLCFHGKCSPNGQRTDGRFAGKA